MENAILFKTNVVAKDMTLLGKMSESELRGLVNKGLCKAIEKYQEEVVYFGCTDLALGNAIVEGRSCNTVVISALAVIEKSVLQSFDELDLDDFEDGRDIDEEDDEENEEDYDKDDRPKPTLDLDVFLNMGKELTEFAKPLAEIFSDSVMNISRTIHEVHVATELKPEINSNILASIKLSAYCRKRKIAMAKGKVPKKIVIKSDMDFDFKRPENMQDKLDKLFRMPGLKEPKEVLNLIIASSAVEKEQRARGLQVSGRCWHMVFSGAPGTAKTTFAESVAEILADAGIVPKKKLMVYTRADLVGQYVGQSETKTREALERGKGGVIFIDEAYSLVGEGNDFGPVVVNELVAFMDANRHDTVLIFAGYPGPMQDFLNMNEGLRSRIMFHLNFKSYSNEELWEITNLLAKDMHYVVDPKARARVEKYFAYARLLPGFGNGRTARNYLELTINRQRQRLYRCEDLKMLTNEELLTLNEEDFQECKVEHKVKLPRRHIGFDVCDDVVKVG